MAYTKIIAETVVDNFNENLHNAVSALIKEKELNKERLKLDLKNVLAKQFTTLMKSLDLDGVELKFEEKVIKEETIQEKAVKEWKFEIKPSEKVLENLHKINDGKSGQMSNGFLSISEKNLEKLEKNDYLKPFLQKDPPAINIEKFEESVNTALEELNQGVDTLIDNIVKKREANEKISIDNEWKRELAEPLMTIAIFMGVCLLVATVLLSTLVAPGLGVGAIVGFAVGGGALTLGTIAGGVAGPLHLNNLKDPQMQFKDFETNANKISEKFFQASEVFANLNKEIETAVTR